MDMQTSTTTKTKTNTITKTKLLVATGLLVASGIAYIVVVRPSDSIIRALINIIAGM